VYYFKAQFNNTRVYVVFCQVIEYEKLAQWIASCKCKPSAYWKWQNND